VDIVWLGRGACGNCALVGGKGSAVCHLAVDYQIPPTFCVTAAAFMRWAAQVDAAGGQLPDPLYIQVEQAYRQMEASCASDTLRVAVRSSAMDEDGQAACLPANTRPSSTSSALTQSLRPLLAAGPRRAQRKRSPTVATTGCRSTLGWPCWSNSLS
jgi:hypothetical protein